MDLKRCTSCHDMKPLDDYYERANGRHEARCKPCVITANNTARAERRRAAREARAALPEPTHRTCTQCHTLKASADYYDKRAECKDCLRRRARARYADPAVAAQISQRNQVDAPGVRERQRQRRLSKYGMTAPEYDALFDGQGGRCACCGRVGRRAGIGEGTRYSVLCVDHDHDTGAIRGLLCHTCNRGIGLFGDNIEMLEQAIAYLKRMSAKEALA